MERGKRPLSESDHNKLRDALHALAELLVRTRNTEKTSSVVGAQEGSQTGTQPDNNATRPPGHGRNGAEAFGGAQKVDIKHQNLTHGDRCPECGKGNVYGQKEPKVLVRIVGQAPLAATVYALERLRCGACGQVFTAQEPDGVGTDKYDETAAAMIAQLQDIQVPELRTTGWNNWKSSWVSRCRRPRSGRSSKLALWLLGVGAPDSM